MPNKLYGYIRVSTKEQNESRQLLALLEYGVASANIYSDKQSGGDFDRPGYKRLLNELRSGDILVIKSIDRLGRNYGEILEQWRLICTATSPCSICRCSTRAGAATSSVR